MILFEMLINPINPYIPGGREYFRYRGLYADGIDYTMQWSFALLCLGYFYLKSRGNSNQTFTLLLLIITIETIGLIYLHQAVAYGIFCFLIPFILIFLFKKNKVHFFVMVSSLILIFLFFYIPNFFRLSSLLGLDIKVISGNAGINAGANGRVGIWLEGLSNLSQLPFFSILFGNILSGKVFYKFIGSGAHSDYLRILFATGFIGLIFYFIFIIKSFFITLKLNKPEKFICMGTIGTLILFSVSHTPTFYPPFVYFFAVIFAFIIKTKLSIKDSDKPPEETFEIVRENQNLNDHKRDKQVIFIED